MMAGNDSIPLDAQVFVRAARSLAISVWIGTDDTGATDTDPTGGGAAGNNMVAVQTSQYDGGMSRGDGTMTERRLPVDGNPANDRVTGFEYDWRDRQVRIGAAQDWYQINTLDNLDRATQVDKYSQVTNTLIRRRGTNYDNRGRAYQTLRYGVDSNSGAVGNVLTDNLWYDPAGNILMTLPAGSRAFTKSVFDALSRQTIRYIGFYPGIPTYVQAVDISGATIVEQAETAWDEANNSIQAARRLRFHNATGTGQLTYPGGPQPQARVTYAADYPDGIGRNQAMADYGTNGDSPFTRSDTIPANSDTILVSLTLYNDRGEPYQSVDAMGKVDQTRLDDAARRVETIQNYQAGAPSSGDVNVTVQWTHTADDLTATIKALNATTGDQLTTLNYGTTLGTSNVARNDALSSVVYADGGTVKYLVNRQSEGKQFSDQNGTVHDYVRDLFGTQTSDTVTALGTGIDGMVRRIGRTFDVRGLLEHVTSFSDAAGTSVVNDVLRVYNSFEQAIGEYQEHNGAVNTSTSPMVGYQFADGSANAIRQTGLVYPNGRLVTLDYGVAGGIDDAMSRVASLIDDDGIHLVDYTRIGVDTFVQASSPQPQIAWSLINGTGIDPYTGLDQFNRVADNRWYSTATSADLDRIQHGYDRAGNRVYRKNTVAEAAGVYLDELYAHEGLYRLARLDRGQLNSMNTGIVAGTEDFTQAWGLDATGNWTTFNQADTGGSWTLNQTRTSNAVNEITGISGGAWVVPIYDAAGNMVQMPKPDAPTSGYVGVYDAWDRQISISAGSSLVAGNSYDGLTRRITKAASGAIRHQYYSLDWRDLEERLGGTATADRQFVWGLRYIDQLVLRDRDTERLYAVQDANWDISSICISNGALVERYQYAAYGMPTFFTSAFAVLSTSAYSWETLFASYRWDVETGAYVVRYRNLHSLLGVWEQADTLFMGEAAESFGAYSWLLFALASRSDNSVVDREMSDSIQAGAINLYAYGIGRPLVRTDPSGLLPLLTVPLPCSAAESAQCKTDCTNDITIRTSKGRATLSASICLKIVSGNVCITNCSCFYRTTVVSPHDRLCPNTCPPPVITIDRRQFWQRPQHGCRGDHWHFRPYDQLPFPDCQCEPGHRYFGGCLPQGAIIT